MTIKGHRLEASGLQNADLDIFADYNCVYLEDEQRDGFSPEWSDQELADMATVSESTVIFCPVRAMSVPVRVEIHTAETDESLQSWDHVVECSVHSPTGRMSIQGGTGPATARLSLEPGWYQVKMLYAGLDSLSNYDLDGDDHYKIVLWPGPQRPLQVVKRWTRKT